MFALRVLRVEKAFLTRDACLARPWRSREDILHAQFIPPGDADWEVEDRCWSEYILVSVTSSLSYKFALIRSAAPA